MRPAQYADYANHARVELLPFVPPGVTSVLDVGCAAGGWASTLRAHLGSSPRIVGIEAVAAQVLRAQSSGMDAVHHGYFPDDLPAAEGKFDLLTFNDVLEHMLDPWSALMAAHKYIAPDGAVLASIPNIQFGPVVLNLIRGRWDYADDGILDRTHLRFFTKATMVEMFETCGYSLERVTGINPVGHAWQKQHGAVTRAALRAGRTVLGNAQYSQFVIVARPLV